MVPAWSMTESMSVQGFEWGAAIGTDNWDKTMRAW